MVLPIREDGSADAATVALIHAAGTSSLVWSPLIPHLSDHRILRLDLPGHGEARSLRWTSLEDVARQALDTLDARARHLGAVSLGSYVALHMLRLAPDRFETAVLSGIHPGGMPNRGMMKLASALMALALKSRRAVRRNAEMLKIPENQRPAYVEEARKTRGQALRRATNDVVDFELPPGLDRVTADVTIAAGGNEHPLILNGVKTLADAFPNGRTYVADGLGHAWPSQDPARFAELVRSRIQS